MLSQVIAKNIGNVFLRHSVQWLISVGVISWRSALDDSWSCG